MGYKYQYNPGVDNVSIHENGRPRDLTLEYNRRQQTDEEEEKSISGGTCCCLSLLVIVAQILLHGVLALTLYWVIKFRWDPDKSMTPFDWEGTTPEQLERQWNLHPVLMITGFIYLTGQAMLVYRTCRCCRRFWSKLLHTIFHLLTIPCITIGFISVWNYHSLRKDKDDIPSPLPHFYSIHSWIGLATMGLFLLQFLVGMFSFVLLLCCSSSTARFRSSLVPLHSIIGTITFMMAIATAVTGLTEKAFFELSITYPAWVPYLSGTPPSQLPQLGTKPYTDVVFHQTIVINCLAAGLVACGILIPILVLCPSFRTRRN